MRDSDGADSPGDADELVVVLDGTGKVREWNRATLEATGYGEARLAGTPVTELFVEADAGRIEQAFASALDSGTATVRSTVVDADGGPTAYEFTVRRLPGEDDPTLIGVGCELPESRATDLDGRAVLDRMSDAFFAVDPEWRITFVNERGGEILADAMGRDPPAEIDELTGLHLWEEIPDVVDTVFYEKYHAAMGSQETKTFEAYYEPMDVWFDVRAYPSETGLSVFFTDVTGRRWQREALEHRERVLRELHDVVADRGLSFTEQVTALLELGRKELDTSYGTLSKIRGDEYVFEVVDADSGEIEAGDVVPLAATNCEVAATREETLVLGDVARDAPTETHRAGYAEWGIACYIGAPVFVDEEVYGTFCFYDDVPREGQFSEWEVTLVDLMSRWVSYELQRQRSTEQLRRQNEKLERFASVVSHDLRSPLTVLEGRLELASTADEPVPFDRCFAAIDRMKTLIDDLLVLARAGATIDERTTVDLDEMSRGCWQTVSTSTATLVVETDRTVEADRTRLRQLFENLFRNAVEHSSSSTSPPSQAQGDALEHAEEQVTVTVGNLPDGFYVEDDGIGIGPADRESVFESGYTTAEDGTGFGLAIVGEIVDAHGWEVRVTESDSGGARFEFTGVGGE